MKNKLLLLPLCFTAIALATGCSNGSTDKFLPTYGSRADTGLTNISYSELYTKIQDEESMVVVTYPKGTSCSCWKTFEVITNNYVLTSDVLLYSVNVYEIKGQDNTFGLVLTETAPTLAFFKNGKKYKQYVYSTKNTQPFFQYAPEFKKFINDNVEKPQLIYVNEDILDEAIVNKKDFIVQHLYHSCPDCSYCLPNVLDPYVHENRLSKEIWLMDLEVEGLLLNNGVKDNTNPNYIAYKKKFGLSKDGSSDFGYVNGKVPTIQFYKKGVLFDASVYFNDELKYDANTETATIIDSFYDDERINKLHYLDSVENKVIKGLTLTKDQITLYKGTYAVWNHDSASLYHTPLLKAFLDKYAK